MDGYFESEPGEGGFCYTGDKHIKRMDDSFILSRITEKYPDFNPSSSESVLKQAFMVVASDTRLINELTSKYDITAHELFKLIFRNYSFLFNPCFVSKLQKIVSKRAYAKTSKTAGRKKPQGAGKKAGR
jgi:hypothetical protein